MGNDVFVAATKIANEFHCSPDLVRRATSHFQRQLSRDLILDLNEETLLTRLHRRGTIPEWGCDKLHPVSCYVYA